MNDQLTHPEMSWSGWGDPAQAVTLSEAMIGLLGAALAVQHPISTVDGTASVAVPDAQIGISALSRLQTIVGANHVSAAHDARVRHTRGKSTPDLIRMRAGDGSDAPDVIVSPAGHDEVLRVLKVCAELRIAVVPFGGGTSVVGGLTPERDGFAGVISLDLGRLDALTALDEESRIATLGPGLRGPEAEALLRERGYTIGHHPQSFEYATLGGFAAVRSSGQASAGYGRFDENVVGLTVATPAGSIELGRAPKSAAGPDLRQLFLGSEGALGVITALTVQVRPVPAVTVYDGWRFPDFASGAAAMRRLVQDGPRPTVLRLSDEVETALNLARPTQLAADASAEAPGDGGCLAIVGFEGAAGDVSARRAGATSVLNQLGGEPDLDAGGSWSEGRYHGPYLRDALLSQGALVEALETVTFWSGLAGLRAAVTAALQKALGPRTVLMCHISHVYPSGASLYFTVACAATTDPVAQWREAKAAASDAIIAHGGVITHHHGIGADHRSWYAKQIGPLGVELLRAAKAVVDPAGILNPGILVP